MGRGRTEREIDRERETATEREDQGGEGAEKEREKGEKEREREGESGGYTERNSKKIRERYKRDRGCWWRQRREMGSDTGDKADTGGESQRETYRQTWKETAEERRREGQERREGRGHPSQVPPGPLPQASLVRTVSAVPRGSEGQESEPSETIPSLL